MKNDDLGKKLIGIHKKYTDHESRYDGDDIFCSQCFYGTYDIHSDDLSIELEEAKQVWPLLKKPKEI